MKATSKQIDQMVEALQSIRQRAMEHPCFEPDLFDERDWDGLIEEGGDGCDWTATAIEADDALKEMGMGVDG